MILGKYFILGIKSNRTVAISEGSKQQGGFKSIKSLDMKDNSILTVWLKEVDFPVKLLKKVFTNENGNEGTLYLITNDLGLDSPYFYELYQKRWRIEEYHKSIKQNANLAKSPTKVIRSQCNHIFSVLVAYCKLEKLKIQTKLNHFAIKYKLLVKANLIAFKELQNIATISTVCVT